MEAASGPWVGVPERDQVESLAASGTFRQGNEHAPDGVRDHPGAYRDTDGCFRVGRCPPEPHTGYVCPERDPRYPPTPAD